MIATHCLLCGRRAKTIQLYPARLPELTGAKPAIVSTSVGMHFRIVKCTRCGLLFSNPIYPRYFHSSQEKVSDDNRTMPSVVAVQLKLVERHRLYLPANPAVLEINCGNGVFLNALRARFGWTKLNGIESTDSPLTEGNVGTKPVIVRSDFRVGQFMERSMDMVCCFHSLEMMADPLNTVREIFRILAPGGLVVFTACDTSHLTVRLLGERSHIFDLNHAYFFNRNTLSELLIREGLGIVTNEQLVDTYPIRHWIRIANLPHPVAAVVKGTLGLLGGMDTPLSLAGGNFAIVARKPIVISHPTRRPRISRH